MRSGWQSESEKKMRKRPDIKNVLLKTITAAASFGILQAAGMVERDMIPAAVLTGAACLIWLVLYAIANYENTAEQKKRS